MKSILERAVRINCAGHPAQGKELRCFTNEPAEITFRPERDWRPQRFTELTAKLANSTEEVKVMRGCIVSHEPLAEVAKQIGQGKSRF